MHAIKTRFIFTSTKMMIIIIAKKGYKGGSVNLLQNFDLKFCSIMFDIFPKLSTLTRKKIILKINICCVKCFFIRHY